jgi:hypothetical protein
LSQLVNSLLTASVCTQQKSYGPEGKPNAAKALLAHGQPPATGPLGRHGQAQPSSIPGDKASVRTGTLSTMQADNGCSRAPTSLIPSRPKPAPKSAGGLGSIPPQANVAVPLAKANTTPLSNSAPDSFTTMEKKSKKKKGGRNVKGTVPSESKAVPATQSGAAGPSGVCLAKEEVPKGTASPLVGSGPDSLQAVNPNAESGGRTNTSGTGAAPIPSPEAQPANTTVKPVSHGAPMPPDVQFEPAMHSYVAITCLQNNNNCIKCAQAVQQAVNEHDKENPPDVHVIVHVSSLEERFKPSVTPKGMWYSILRNFYMSLTTTKLQPHGCDYTHNENLAIMFPARTKESEIVKSYPIIYKVLGIPNSIPITPDMTCTKIIMYGIPAREMRVDGPHIFDKEELVTEFHVANGHLFGSYTQGLYNLAFQLRCAERHP